LALAQALRRSGLRPGILSRGYRGANESPRAVAAGDDAEGAGDEPLLLAERSACPVWIGADRVAAAHAVRAAGPARGVLRCGDGLQHYRLRRDFEIAVEDERGLGNGLLLPAGPLREPAHRRVDAAVINGGQLRPGTFAMRLVVAGLHRVADASPLPRSELSGK